MQTIKKDGQTRRAEILAAAKAILARDGASALTLRAVAGAVGIRLASLQYHFATYGALIGALADDLVEHHAPALEAIAGKSGQAPADRLDAALRWLAADAPQDEVDARLAVQFWALALVNDDAREALARYHGRYVDYLQSLVRDAFPKLSPAAARARAVAIASLLEGSILFIDFAASPRSRARLYRQIYQSARAIAHGRPDA